MLQRAVDGAGVGAVKSEDAEASVQADLDAIRALIQKYSGGFGTLNDTVRQYLRRWFVSQGGVKSVARHGHNLNREGTTSRAHSSERHGSAGSGIRPDHDTSSSSTTTTTYTDSFLEDNSNCDSGQIALNAVLASNADASYAAGATESIRESLV